VRPVTWWISQLTSAASALLGDLRDFRSLTTKGKRFSVRAIFTDNAFEE
jgi:hypothetical protein